MRTIFIFITLNLSIAAHAGVLPHQIGAELRRAAVFESQNDLASAQKIYRALHDQYPERTDILLRYERVLARTGQHADAARLLRKRLAASPDDVFARLRLGDALFAMGKRDSAYIYWEAVVQKANNQGTFAQVLSRYRQHNLDDRAAALYKHARRVLKQPGLFARELAELAERQTRYEDAVREYITFLDQQPQYRSLIEARLRDFAQNGDQREAVFARLSNELRAHPQDASRIGMMVEYALPAGLASRALDLLLHTPELPANIWSYLFRIAQFTLDAEDAETAMAAYHALYDRAKRPDRQARALLGLARAAGIGNDTRAARTYYLTLIKNHKNRRESDEARFRLAIIQRDIDGDPDAARQTLSDLINTHRRTPWRYRALFELAEGHLLADRFQDAERALQGILVERRNEVEAAQARYRLAELQFFAGAPDSAQTLLQSLLNTDRSRDVINDAIALSSLIQEGLRTNPDLLRAFALARRLHRQQRLKEALEKYVALSEAHPESFLADRLLHHRAEILERLNRFPEAIQTHRQLIASTPWSPFCPSAQMALARIYDDRLKQYYDAQKAYETLLIDYPLSLEADLARERLRLLKGKIKTLKSQRETG